MIITPLIPEPQVGGSGSTALIRSAIAHSEEQYWQPSDFSSLLPSRIVCKVFSRLAKDGTLERVHNGLYYRSRMTRFGPSRPSTSDIQHKLGISLIFKPAGATGANLLGFSTQNCIHGAFATSVVKTPRHVINPRTRIYNARPSTWDDLLPLDAALLDFLRTRGKNTELSPQETKELLLKHFKEGDRFDRLLAVAAQEPPRVRAMLGAIGQENGIDRSRLAQLRHTLNPKTTFDFGILQKLHFSKDWQSR